MLHLQNLEFGEDNEFPTDVNFSAVHRLHPKSSENLFDIKRVSNPRHHLRRHHRNRLVHPTKKNLDTNIDDYPFLSSTNHAAFNSSMEVLNDNVNQKLGKFNFRPVSCVLE